MGLSRLSKQCKNCPYVKTCEYKRMEAFAYCEPLVNQGSASAVGPIDAPVMAKHDYRDVKVAENTTITIDVEELKENMCKSIYKGAFDIFRSAT